MTKQVHVLHFPMPGLLWMDNHPFRLFVWWFVCLLVRLFGLSQSKGFIYPNWLDLVNPHT